MRVSPRAVALRAAGVILIAVALVLAGALVDRWTGSGPVFTVSSLAIAVLLGTVMIRVIVFASFPKAADEQQSDQADAKKQAR